ncbi:hypothetical protein NVP1089O_03 [Vibrio phage 1.089.O._10N.261.51.F9]|nr:hypothetical protein NVP1012O_03 [Vibrio phage 1.012.O._10N.261.48.C12]AUR86741.1 hypothetical protein NVP1089O_03 [Vibrio phage 1.089.O._10N.261.51.F9]AUR87247.1 hypothetical protein NVP1098O_03 [Vibrio phage 1.098.O._10N.286.51.B9]AUR87753.1 hypothetical protein NVP1104O_03 [Vibrio phage 1.104.O._10N.286.49.A12]AUR88763.1 hypothetical protein NVP1118A_03 [Vibrio phage 1.118.A._10N.261.49.F6]AUR88859.1 hypothetical protein NVP1118B_03 [Vibrio phage 1.118.B._10N.261.49.F6]AUR91352.1 hypoth
MTTFEIRHALLQMLGNDTTAYEIANGFVTDDENKLAVFRDAFNEPTNSVGGFQERASTATDKATKRWDIVGKDL